MIEGEVGRGLVVFDPRSLGQSFDGVQGELKDTEILFLNSSKLLARPDLL